MKWANRNEAWAAVFVEELARCGIREACVAPGSRSAPLVLALAREARIRTFVHLDERSAAYFALGIGKATGRTAAVLTTSGTAAANLFPAVIEASQSGTPLLLMTADRPHRLRGQAANQTIDQLRLFGPYTRLFHDVAPPRVRLPELRYVRVLAARATAAASGPPAGPVHLNFPFDKPLEPTPSADDGPEGLETSSGPEVTGRARDLAFTEAEAGRAVPGDARLDELAARVAETPRGLIVCGPASEPWRVGPAALRLAEASGYPILADPLSGARFGSGAPESAVAAYDLLLRAEEAWPGLAPDVVIRTGLPATSAALERFFALKPAPTLIAVDAGERWSDPAGLATHFLRADAAETLLRVAERLPERTGAGAAAANRWRKAWRAAEDAARGAVKKRLTGELFEGAAVAQVASLLPSPSTLFIGNSMPARDLDAFALPREAAVRVLGNRGASGIDGTVSTALGAAAVSEGPTVAVLGDVALYHDMNGLLAARRFGLEITFVVLNNDGGGIFHFLPIRQFEPPFTSHFVAPHGLDFRHAARLHDFQWEEGATREALREAVGRALVEGGRRIVEVPSDGATNRSRHEAVVEAVRRAVAERLGDRG
ncbi:MAG: 2-succinyl-5-enolpyruvyl-6-hydroxy-3-cyclohexene-1-carboxylic-acid synthase [Gemmatimonadota bacterium]